MRRTGLIGALLIAITICLVAPAHAAASLARFASKVNPYSITYPAAWRHASGHLSGTFSLFSYDQFYDPTQSHGFNVNVVVARLPLPAPMTTLAYARQSEQNLRDRGDTVHEAGSTMLAGRRVTLIAYTDSRAHTQAYLVVAKQLWVFSLTTATGDLGPWLTTYRSMLQSVKLL